MSFSDQFDIELREIDENNLILRCKMDDNFLNELNAVHGGVIMSLADNASGYIASAKKYTAPTLSMTTHFLRPLMATDYIYAKAKVIKRGSRIITVDCEVYGDNKEIAAITRSEFAIINSNLEESTSGDMAYSKGKYKKF
ncbi:PaaI family thioesterase [uncultured Anaerococcus sp.]|uniref:PaaI family thioesterase n=1 Tax=uncultured Anaerococcus sp. TaxID=293428 RepID=UPI002619E406|nr:PaaI family thioesterase [uncultured Anaerococcus sp.]